MIASHQKQKLMETMERMKTSKGWAALSKGGGAISIEDIERLS